MARYELVIKILDERYIDRLLVALARQGYDVYYNSQEESKGIVCFTVDESDLTKIRDKGGD